MIIEPINNKLELKNSGNLEIVFIGTGTPFTNTIYNTNFILIKGDTHLMVDFGFNAPISLREIAGLNPEDIDTIMPTHSHSDHIGGFEYLALYNRYIARPTMKKSKLNIVIVKKYKKILWKQSLRGGMESNEIDNDKRRLTFKDYFNPIYPTTKIIDGREVFLLDFNGIHLEIFKTIHIPDTDEIIEDDFPSFGLFVDGKIFISCDTKFDRELIDFYADKSEIMFHDCSFSPNPVHSWIENLRKLPVDIKSKMMLMHYSDDWEKQNVSDFKGLAIQGKRYIFD